MKELTDGELFLNYCEAYAPVDGSEPFTASLDDLLQFWRPAKEQYLYKLLGEEFIISRDVTFERSVEELAQDMDAFLQEEKTFIRNFTSTLRNALGLPADYWSVRGDNRTFFDEVINVLSAYYLREGRLISDWPNVVINDTPLEFCQGQKLMKVLGKIASAIKLDHEFEQFRIRHSQVLNQKKLTGTLCLSIHPLDYATASDNDCGWTSCMSWQESGCYRMGTVEMMNSPMVICAYLASSHTNMEVPGGTWNSKKWRAWIIIDEHGILCNRNFPYVNDTLAVEAIQWVRQLAHDNLGWDYEETIDSCAAWKEKGFGFHYTTRFMYNDFKQELWLSPRVGLEPGRYQICFSGAANCMNCGRPIEFPGSNDDNVSDTLLCAQCNNLEVCSSCGDTLLRENVYYGPNGEVLCEDCYCNLVSHCEYCDEDVYAEDLYNIEVHWDIDKAKEFIFDHKEDMPQLYNRYFFKGYSEWTETWHAPHNWVEHIICSDCLYSRLEAYVDPHCTLDMPMRSSWRTHRMSSDYLDPDVCTVEDYEWLISSSVSSVELPLYVYMYKCYRDYIQNHPECRC